MLLATTLASLAALSAATATAAAAAEALNPADFRTMPALHLIQPSSSDDAGCPPPQVPCFDGCMDPGLLCCKHVRNPTPWSCLTTEKCGPHPVYGCWVPKPTTTAAVTETALAPLTSTFEPASLSQPAGSAFNPTFTVSVPAVDPPPRKTGRPSGSGGGGDGVASFVARPTPVPLTSVSGRKRETCFFDAAEENTPGSERIGEVCPGSLASSSVTVTEVVNGSGVAATARSWGVTTLVGLVVVVMLDRLF